MVVSLTDGSGDALAWSAALGDASIASVILRAADGRRLDPARVRPFVEMVQRLDRPALIENDVDLARHVNADGVHLTYEPSDDGDAVAVRYKAARAELGADRIVGVCCGMMRHDAMVAGELGADYVAFERVGGADLEVLVDIVSWWAEVIEVPAVAWCTLDAGGAAAALAAGADFAAVGATTPSGAATALASLRSAS